MRDIDDLNDELERTSPFLKSHKERSVDTPGEEYFGNLASRVWNRIEKEGITPLPEKPVRTLWSHSASRWTIGIAASIALVTSLYICNQPGTGNETQFALQLSSEEALNYALENPELLEGIDMQSLGLLESVVEESDAVEIDQENLEDWIEILPENLDQEMIEELL